jgi:hypothetical protein
LSAKYYSCPISVILVHYVFYPHMIQKVAKEATLLPFGSSTMRPYQAAMRKHNSVAGRQDSRIGCVRKRRRVKRESHMRRKEPVTKRTNLKKSVAAIVTAGILTIGVATFATEALSPAQIVGDLTGQTVQAARTEGETYGTVAKEAGVLETFQDSMLENRKTTIVERVADGTLTQAEADELLAAMDEHMVSCDGNGAKIGGATANGQGRGQMMRDGTGEGAPGGRGMGRGAASATN